MRCAGEIDITRPRWRERPGALVPAILSNVRSFSPVPRVRRFEQGAQEAAETERGRAAASCGRCRTGAEGR